MTTQQLLVIGVLVAAAIATPWAKAQTYTVLHSFTGADGQYPHAGVIRDSAGNLYGTTYQGGASGHGVVFKLDTTGTETVLYNFAGGTDGADPTAGVIRDSAGNLYGTTSQGGPSGYGVVFKLDTTGKETVLHNFTIWADGVAPYAGVIRDSPGNLYGTTYQGGTSRFGGGGVAFKLDATGTYTVLHRFTEADGWNPEAGVIRDSAGTLYGTTCHGGTWGHGVVFKLDTTGTYTVLYNFTGGADGAGPLAGVIRDSAGNLYGTTYGGGASSDGVVFKLDTTGTETVLYNFTGETDGAHPGAGMIRDSAGNLYGTTLNGGKSHGGVVFKLDTTGKEIVLHSFTGGPGGYNPFAGLIPDSADNLYGTTAYGGTSGAGVVFKLAP